MVLEINVAMTALSNLFGVGGSSLISRFLGANEHKKASHCCAFCIWTTTVSAFLYDSDNLAYDSWNCKNQDRFGNRHTAKQHLIFFFHCASTSFRLVLNNL